ncbi:MAG: hypothetical protein II254_00660 [Oscillospiraceae bacterium]|nr:hypothetical protein [Oscillospiraceae bacterium]
MKKLTVFIATFILLTGCAPAGLRADASGKVSAETASPIAVPAETIAETAAANAPAAAAVNIDHYSKRGDIKCP